MDNLENNKLIAEFMAINNEFDFCDIDDYYFSFKKKDIENIDEWIDEVESTKNNLCKLKDFYDSLLYHSSWDWLMPVVEKIESLDLRKNGYDFPKVKIGNGVEIFCYATYRGTCYEWKQWMSISGELHDYVNQYDTKIKAVYKAIIEFIKWYNKTKKQ